MITHLVLLVQGWFNILGHKKTDKETLSVFIIYLVLALA